MTTLTEIKDRLAKITQGHWCADKGKVRCSLGGPPVGTTGSVVWAGMRYAPEENIYNAEFIAHSPADFAWCVEQIEAKDARIAELEAALDRAREWVETCAIEPECGIANMARAKADLAALDAAAADALGEK